MKIKNINMKCSQSHKINQSKSVLHQTEPWKASVQIPLYESEALWV